MTAASHDDQPNTAGMLARAARADEDKARCERFDRGELQAHLTSTGFLKVDAFLTRAGVFNYVTADGRVTRELRSPEEVFKADSLASLELVPVTDDHPSARVDATNVKDVAVGHVGDAVTRDGEKVRAKILITDAKAIAKVQAGKRETSCGYTCDVEATSGTYNGAPYDVVQKNIRYNHVAIVDRGRAGPDVRLRIDSISFAAMQENMSEDSQMKVRIDEVDFEAPEALAQAVAKLQRKCDDAAKLATDTKAEADKSKAKLDALTEDLAKAQKARDDAASPAKTREAVKARLTLERSAAKVLGDERLDDIADDEIMRKAIVKAAPSAKLDGVSAEYLRARFDHIVETVGERSIAGANSAAGNAGETRADSAKARTEMIKRQSTMWQKPLTASAKGANS